MNRVIERMANVLTADGWVYQHDEENDLLKATVATQNADLHIILLGFPEDSFAGVLVRLPIRVPEEKRALAANFLMRANWGLRLGNFELDFSDGEVRFRIAVDFEESELSDAMVRNMVSAALHVSDRYYPGLSTVLHADRLPEDAIELVESDVFDLSMHGDPDETLN